MARQVVLQVAPAWQFDVGEIEAEPRDFGDGDLAVANTCARSVILAVGVGAAVRWPVTTSGVLCRLVNHNGPLLPVAESGSACSGCVDMVDGFAAGMPVRRRGQEGVAYGRPLRAGRSRPRPGAL